MPVWKSVDTYPGIEPGWYEVSDDGQVRSWRKAANQTTSDQRAAFPRVLRPSTDRHNRKSVMLTSQGKHKRVFMHRLICFSFYGAPPSAEHVVAHWDGDPSNNSLANLRWATKAENQSDRIRHGTDGRGSRNPMSKICEATALEIFRRTRSGETCAAVADCYGLSTAHVHAIKTQSAWKWLTDGL